MSEESDSNSDEESDEESNEENKDDCAKILEQLFSAMATSKTKEDKNECIVKGTKKIETFQMKKNSKKKIVAFPKEDQNDSQESKSK